MTRREAEAFTSIEVERFLSGLVHDLRNLLDGVTMTLLQNSADPTQRSLKEVTFRNVYDVLRKAEDFLDRACPPNRVDGNAEVSPIVERAFKGLGPFLRDRSLSFTSSDGVWVAVDTRVLRRIIENVVHVLSKYTEKGAEIRLSMRRGDYVDLTFEVPQLAVSTVPTELFSPDFKDGLDLWVSRERVRSCGGNLSGEPYEKGLRLELRLPKSEPSEEAKLRPGKKRKVLVVDDNLDSARSFAVLLSSAGFQTEVCRDGASALETAASFEPDALVLDLGLSGMDGYEVCRRVRSAPGGERLLVLAVSGRADDESLAAVRDAGFDGHLLKPVDPKQLIQRLFE
ncbi:MAG TPA: response regulator [Vicinamibacteria bacterium]|nr:response regulator [Vicinamibacteria bacterium]